MQTIHKLYNTDSRYFKFNKLVDLIITSPPYPMIKMWDPIFFMMNPTIVKCFDLGNDLKAWNLMHGELDKVWKMCDSCLKAGGILCINIGDAYRSFKGFRIYPNAAKVTMFFQELGYIVLPPILWRKETNKPTKFMGSGMLPQKAYVTQEFEYILIFKKIGTSETDPKIRKESAFFYDERNKWFSNIWTDIKGLRQTTKVKSRSKSGAFPFELAYRLINMHSVKYDTVMDPFIGTGTTTLACIGSERNSLGIEYVSDVFSEMIERINETPKSYLNKVMVERLYQQFKTGTKNKYTFSNDYHKLPVKTYQETQLMLRPVIEWKDIDSQDLDEDVVFSVEYSNDVLQLVNDKFERTDNSLRKWV